MSVIYRLGPTTLGTKDPDSKLDYTVDWSKYLTTLGGDIIDSSEWFIDGSITASISPAPSFTDKTTTVWLEGGGLLGESNTITNRITTLGGRIEDRSFVLTIADH